MKIIQTIKLKGIRILIIVYLCPSILSFGQNRNNQLLQFNGLYETECDSEKDDDDGTQYYLRFYPEGKVISISTECEGQASDLKEWFNLENTSVSVGNYEIRRNRIQFSTRSKAGTVEYRGRIDKYGFIKLKSKSLINGNKDKKKYRFIQINDLK